MSLVKTPFVRNGLVAITLAATLGLGLGLGIRFVEAKNDDHRKKDIATHRLIAKAHEDAAKCLEAGKEEKQCHDALAQACRGVAIGKYCGMKHAH
jgi:hypothetical protein